MPYNHGSSKWLEDHAPTGPLNAQVYAHGQFPEVDSQIGTLMMNKITSNMKEGGKKGMNMTKITEVLQGPHESPSQFYEWLCETFHLYSPFDPEVAENQRMINAALVSQAQGDIR
jgi:hypothetical protein